MHEKVAIAHQLSRLGVDVCESGFPVASPGDFEAVSIIAKEVGPAMYPGRTQPMVIAGLARAVERDIDTCFEAVKHAPRHRIHTFLATSDIHVSAPPSLLPSSLLLSRFVSPLFWHLTKPLVDSFDPAVATQAAD